MTFSFRLGKMVVICIRIPVKPCASRIILNGNELDLFVDYVDKSELEALSFNNKVVYLEARARLILLDPLKELYEMEKRRVLSRYHFLNLTTVLCCGIEGLGRYMTKEPYYDAFEAFVKKFMPEMMEHYNGKPRAKHLWQNFRNALAHGFLIENGGIEQDQSWYFNEHPEIGLQVNIDMLVVNFENAFEKFFDQLKSEGEPGTYGSSFKERFKDIFLKKTGY